MVEGAMGRRRTGLTRAKTIERLTLWLGLPLLLIVLSLTAGIVNYTPVRRASELPQPTKKGSDGSVERAPAMPSIPMRADRLAPFSAAADLDDGLSLEAPPDVP